MTEAELTLAFETSPRDQGWIPVDASPAVVADLLEDTLGVVRAVAEAVPVETLVRRDFDQVHVFPGTG